MLLKPIGFMRAETGGSGGLNFVDDFTGYTTGQKIDAQTPYTAPYTNHYIRDNSGTRVVRAEGNMDPCTYIAETVADDREVSLTINDINSTAGAWMLYLYYVSNNDRCFIQFGGADGWVSFRQKIAGADQANSQDYNVGTAPVAGNEFTISNNAGTILVKKNGSTIMTRTLAGSPTFGDPGFSIDDGSQTPYNEIREFSVVEL